MPKSDKKSANTSGVFREYLRYTLQYPWLLVAIGLGIAIVQGSTLLYPLYLRQFFNVLAAGHPDGTTVHTLVGILVMVALMWLLDWLGRRIQDPAVAYLESSVMKRLSGDAFTYLIGHSYNFFSSNFAGSLTHKVSKYTRSYEMLFDSVIVQFIPTSLFVFGAIAVLFVHNQVLGTALALWSLLFVWFQVWVARLRQPIRHARAEADTRVTATLADAIGNQQAISLFAAEAHERSIFSGVLEVWRRATLRSWLTDHVIWAGIGLFMIVIEVGLLGGAIYYWQRGMLTIGDFVLIQAYLLTTFDRLVSINRELRRLFDAVADAGEMVAILSTPHEIADAAGAKPLTVGKGAITFDAVDFYFHETRTILKDFSLTIHGGEKVALVGPSGAGKSTIIKLLLRLYDVTGGKISIDDQNIAHITQSSLHEAVAFVPQEPILFHRTLMENIRYGRRDATDEEVIVAAKQAHCHEFISALPLQYDTYVGERGIKLSGGERQRVAIARAILKNAPILVLDEATSSLDSESEALIQDALGKLMENKTVVVIAHRLSTIMKMDRIVVIDGGRVVAVGTHEELLSQGGLYYKLWSIQAGGFLKDEGEEEGDQLETNVEELVEELEEK